jgi:hypothetical protein
LVIEVEFRIVFVAIVIMTTELISLIIGCKCLVEVVVLLTVNNHSQHSADESDEEE